MNPTVLVILRSIAGLIIHPAFKPDSQREQLSALLAMTANLLEHGDEFKERLEDIRLQVESMVAQDRAPTDDEWFALKARYDTAHERIQAGSSSDDN